MNVLCTFNQTQLPIRRSLFHSGKTNVKVEEERRIYKAYIAGASGICAWSGYQSIGNATNVRAD